MRTTRAKRRRRDAIAALVVGSTIVLGLMTVFALELSSNQTKSKQEIEARVHERSLLAAALIDGLFQTSARSTLAQSLRLYSGPRVSNAALDRAQGHDRYVVLLDPSGRVLAFSHGFTGQARADLAFSEALRLLRGGAHWALGNVLPYGKDGVINFGLALPTAAGTRYLLTGFDPQALGPFLLGELREISDVKGAHDFVLDGNGEVIASTNLQRPTGYVFHTPTQLSVLHRTSGDVMNHYFDQVSLHDTSWRILLTAPNGPLFASVAGLRKWLPWLIFAAFGIVALIALGLALRTLRASDQVREANAKLGVMNAQLAEINAALEASNRALELSNDELERRAGELVRSNADLDQFASIASHDLQEPLRKVRTFTERIQATEGDRLSEAGLGYLERANAGAERMQHLIEDLLSYSRVSTQGRQFAPVDLGRVTAEVLDDLAEVVTGAGAVIRVDQLPSVTADPTQMRQLMQNLISNALKFGRDGVTPEVDIRARTEHGWLTLEVRDNGIGFDPQYRRRIFRVFERLHGRGAYPGTGIGLALCRKIAERHGGTVVADSVPDQGATFTVRLQVQPAQAVADVLIKDDQADAQAPPEEPYVTA